MEGGGEILPTEKPHFSRKEIADGWRLGCQVKVKENMVIQVPCIKVRSKFGKGLKLTELSLV